MKWTALWYLVLSLATFAAYLHDQGAAAARRWRTRESTLHTLSLLGGWPGALLAQRITRHKTRKPGFQRVLALTIAANLLAAVTLQQLAHRL